MFEHINKCAIPCIFHFTHVLGVFQEDGWWSEQKQLSQLEQYDKNVYSWHFQAVKYAVALCCSTISVPVWSVTMLDICLNLLKGLE